MLVDGFLNYLSIFLHRHNVSMKPRPLSLHNGNVTPTKVGHSTLGGLDFLGSFLFFSRITGEE